MRRRLQACRTALVLSVRYLIRPQRHVHRLQLPVQPCNPRRRHLRRAVLLRLNHQHHFQKQQVPCTSHSVALNQRVTDDPSVLSTAARCSVPAAAFDFRQAAPRTIKNADSDGACILSSDFITQNCALLGCSAGRGGAWASDAGSSSIRNRSACARVTVCSRALQHTRHPLSTASSSGTAPSPGAASFSQATPRSSSPMCFS